MGVELRLKIRAAMLFSKGRAGLLRAEGSHLEPLFPARCLTFSPLPPPPTPGVPTATATPRRPPAPSERARPLLPPSNLAANRTAGGIVLRWAPPPAPSLLPLAYVLEYRGGPGAWEVLHSAIPAQQDRLLLTGLVK
ncbi:hypothetical protein chiPu_0026763, partial [Chiloscyllium punctatum]|nr:hypothetical protein [Chiloscyllium punctatum]